MINLIRSEIYKLKKSRAFMICTLLCIVFALLGPILLNFSKEMLETMPKEMLEDPTMQSALMSDSGLHIGIGSSTSLLATDEMTGTWYVGQLFPGNALELFLAIFISIFVTAEFATGTIKNVVSKGFGRGKIYLAKLIVSSIASVIMLLIYTIVGFMAGIVVFGLGECHITTVLEILRLVGIQIVFHIALTAIFVMIGMTVRSVAGTLTVNILTLVFVGTIISASNLIIGRNAIDLTQYWIPSIITATSNLTMQANDIIRNILVAMVYFIGSSWIGSKLFQKQDIN